MARWGAPGGGGGGHRPSLGKFSEMLGFPNVKSIIVKIKLKIFFAESRNLFNLLGINTSVCLLLDIKRYIFYK